MTQAMVSLSQTCQRGTWDGPAQTGYCSGQTRQQWSCMRSLLKLSPNGAVILFIHVSQGRCWKLSSPPVTWKTRFVPVSPHVMCWIVSLLKWGYPSNSSRLHLFFIEPPRQQVFLVWQQHGFPFSSEHRDTAFSLHDRHQDKAKP